MRCIFLKLVLEKEGDHLYSTDRVANDEVSLILKEGRNVLHTINGKTVTSFVHVLRMNCLLKHVVAGKVEGRLEVMGRRGRKRKQLLDDLKKRK